MPARNINNGKILYHHSFILCEFHPHIGHSYTNIAADVLARFHRRMNDDVYFLTGTDEHGQKMARAAQEASLSEKDWTDKMVLVFSGCGKSWTSLMMILSAPPRSGTRTR